MSALLEQLLKDISKELNSIQSKRKEFLGKYDTDSKSKLMEEMQNKSSSAKKIVNIHLKYNR
jgi:hypothetical protein